MTPDKQAKQEHRTGSGIEIHPVYRADDLEGWDSRQKLGEPGAFPYTRGIHKEMYRSKLWTMRQYAGFGSAEATNERFKFLLDAGQTGLSCAFDLPTQMGYDSDHPRAEGEVGKVGVAIDSLADMRLLMADLPMEKVTTSMTINATGAILLLLYQLVAEEQGVPAEKIRGTIQNDILKEYIARGTYIYPPRPSMRLIVDTFSYCAANLPSWNTISISGYHIREAGSTAVQEIAFTLANGIAYVEAAMAAGMDIDAFAPRLSFFWNAHNNLFEEVAKYRAARRMWARIMTERFGAKDERSKMLRFHTQTGGSTLTAQQPENNIVRVTLQSLAAALGGTQSLHTNGFDEALGLPTTRAAKIALRTQQIVGFESGVAGGGDRGPLHAGRDRERGLQLRQSGGRRGEDRRRREPIHRCGGGAGRRVPDRHRATANPDRANQVGAGRARPRSGRCGALRHRRHRPGRREPARPDEDGPGCHGNAG